MRLVEGFSDKLLKLMDELPADWEATCSIFQPLGISWGIHVLDPIVKFCSCPIFYSSVGENFKKLLLSCYWIWIKTVKIQNEIV